ncbi:MAG: hypothetical protein N2255_05830 [Kiritimatiellae bacterium]|nr:hypothetical protein [Kiritimatiellia bacterium]
MIECERCGTKNPLGRVFCVSCGAKLSLAGMGREEVAQLQRRARRAAFLRKSVVFVLFLLAAVMILALWPYSSAIGAKGSRVGAGRVESYLRGIERLPSRMRFGPEPLLPEEDINAYLEHVLGARLKGISLSVAVTRKTLRIRLVRTLAEVVIGPIRLVPKCSVEATWTKAGDGLRLRNMVVGHLPLPACLSASVVTGFLNTFAGLPEWKLLQNVKQVALSDGAIGLVVER